MAQRIQRKRTKGWRMPERVVYVGRPTEWGNPFKIGEKVWYEKNGFRSDYFTADNPVQAVEFYRDNECWTGLPMSDLQGKDLACWCALDQPCHADILLELANKEVGGYQA